MLIPMSFSKFFMSSAFLFDRRGFNGTWVGFLLHLRLLFYHNFLRPSGVVVVENLAVSLFIVLVVIRTREFHHLRDYFYIYYCSGKHENVIK